MTLLIIENESDQAELYRALFETDHKVAIFPGGEQALEYLKEHYGELDALLTDHDLDGSLKGLDVIREARTLGFAGTIVMVTGSEEWDIEEQAFLAGVDTLLRKPFWVPDLEEAIGIKAPVAS